MSELLERFFQAVDRDDEAGARALVTSWAPRRDGGARLFRQLQRRGTAGFRIGRTRGDHERSVSELERGERRLYVLVEQGRIAGVRADEAWADGFLKGELPADVDLDDLPDAPVAARRAAQELMGELVATDGHVDAAPFNLRLLVKRAEEVDPRVVASACWLGVAFVRFRVRQAGMEGAVWLFLVEQDGGWRAVEARTAVDGGKVLALRNKMLRRGKKGMTGP